MARTEHLLSHIVLTDVQKNTPQQRLQELLADQHPNEKTCAKNLI